MSIRRWLVVVVLLPTASCLPPSIHVFAQETTGGLQGTIKDASSAVVSKATVELTGSSLAGSKTLETDGSGYYRFANLPLSVRISR